MTAGPEGQFEARIDWPADTHVNAALANFIVMSDDGQGVYLAFGHIPPFAQAPPEGLTTVVPNVKASVYLTYKNTFELAQLLTQFVEMKQGQEGNA